MMSWNYLEMRLNLISPKHYLVQQMSSHFKVSFSGYKKPLTYLSNGKGLKVWLLSLQHLNNLLLSELTFIIVASNSLVNDLFLHAFDFISNSCTRVIPVIQWENGRHSELEFSLNQHWYESSQKRVSCSLRGGKTLMHTCIMGTHTHWGSSFLWNE